MIGLDGLAELDLDGTAWKRYALCAQVDADLWFPTQGEPGAVAKRICADCPVQIECLDYALETKQTWGVWVGLSERERRGLQPSWAKDVAA